MSEPTLSRRHLLGSAAGTASLAAMSLGMAAMGTGPAAALAPADSAGEIPLITVSGKISRFNRGPLHPDIDRLAAKYGVAFQRALTLGLGDLYGLGLHRLRTGYPGWQSPHSFDGPLLWDVLHLAGAEGTEVVVTAADGYQPVIPLSDLTTWEVILSLTVDNRDLQFGGAGPSWIVYPRDDHPDLQQQDDAKWAWAAFHFEVR